MADEIRNSLLITNGGRAAEIILPGWHQVLYDPADIRSLLRLYPFPGGSDVTSITKVPAPPTAAAVSSEISGGTSNTAFTTSEVQLTLVQQQVQVQISDLLGITAAPGQIDAAAIITWLSNCMALRITDQAAALLASFSGNTVGSGSGDNMTVDHFYSAMYKLNASLVPGEGIALVQAPASQNQFVESLRGEGGSLQYSADAAGMLMAKGPGYKGSLLGVQVWQSDSVTNTGGAYKNGMFGYGALGYQIGPIERLVGLHIPSEEVVMTLPGMIIERGRDAVNNMSTFYAKFYSAVVEVEDLRGCLVNVDS